MNIIDLILKLVLYISGCASVVVLLSHKEINELNSVSVALMFYIVIIIIANNLHNEVIQDRHAMLLSISKLNGVNSSDKLSVSENNYTQSPSHRDNHNANNSQT